MRPGLTDGQTRLRAILSDYPQDGELWELRKLLEADPVILEDPLTGQPLSAAAAHATYARFQVRRWADRAALVDRLVIDVGIVGLRASDSPGVSTPPVHGRASCRASSLGHDDGARPPECPTTSSFAGRSGALVAARSGRHGDRCACRQRFVGRCRIASTLDRDNDRLGTGIVQRAERVGCDLDRRYAEPLQQFGAPQREWPVDGDTQEVIRTAVLEPILEELSQRAAGLRCLCCRGASCPRRSLAVRPAGIPGGRSLPGSPRARSGALPGVRARDGQRRVRRLGPESPDAGRRGPDRVDTRCLLWQPQRP